MEKRIERKDTLRLLHKIDEILRKENKTYNILAYGGTALTLYGFKGFTKDIDLLIENIKDEDVGLVRKIKNAAKEFGIKLDLELGHQIVWWNLLDDYWELAEEEKIESLTNINLKKLNIYDIIISKCARYSDIDIDDIISILKSRTVDNEFLKQRFALMVKAYRGYPTQKKRISENFDQILKLIHEYQR